jgi:hypothetical protein
MMTMMMMMMIGRLSHKGQQNECWHKHIHIFLKHALQTCTGNCKLIPVAERFKARVCGRSLAGIVGSNAAGVMDVCPLWVLCVVK